MNISKSVIAIAAVTLAGGASAAVTGSLGGGTGTFLSLSSAGLSGAATATLAGGTVYSASVAGAAKPAGTIFGGTFLAAGPTAGTTATLTFSSLINEISFLWGSPDSYNLLTVTSLLSGPMTFTASSLGIGTITGNQAFAQYVDFTSTPGDYITSLSFTNSPANDAFETANFNVRAVPEPAVVALLFAGLGAVGFVARRRRRVDS